MKYDALIVGGGIAGLESALTLGDMGYEVLLVEKEASIGGKMVLLSKVFPTLDCASCISTPKMAAAAHHPHITILTYSEINEIVRNGNGGFNVKIHKKPTFVDLAACTGCSQCETVCTVPIPDQFNYDLVARRAAYIPYPQAVPKKALIDRYGSSPCSFACPAGIKAHGYVSLVRAGKFEEAFRLLLEDAPLPGSLSRICFAPCEKECTRGEFEGPVPIREIKRFIVDRYYKGHPEPEYGPPEKLLDNKVAVIGSGPAGLSTAYQLAQKGYRVTIFESAHEVGGMLRYGIPAYQLPRDLVDRDIKNIIALGVEIQTNTMVTSVKALKEQGFVAVFVAVGIMEAQKMTTPGEELEGVVDSMTFLREVESGERGDLSSKTVMVAGGGDTAIEPARVALRLGAKKVIVQYRQYQQDLNEIPVPDWEIDTATPEGIELQLLKTPKRFIGVEGRLVAVQSLSMKLGEPGSNNGHRPVPVEGSEEITPIDLAVLAIRLHPNTNLFRQELDINMNGAIAVNAETLETSVPSVFAGGDGVTGPSSVAKAIGQGNRAAFYIDRYLKGEPLTGVTFDARLPVVDKDSVISRSESISRRAPVTR